MDLHEQKKQLRKTVSARLKALPDAYRVSASDAIQDRVLETPEYRQAQRIFLYLHMPTEPDTDRIIRQAIADGKAVYVPKCTSKTEMIAVRIRSFDALAPGAYGILEPLDCSETIEPDAIDLILVPCVSAARTRRGVLRPLPEGKRAKNDLPVLRTGAVRPDPDGRKRRPHAPRDLRNALNQKKPSSEGFFRVLICGL